MMLPPRDADVLELTLEGKAPAEIADELGLSRHTVYHAQMRLRRRWLARDNGDLIRLEYHQRLTLMTAERDDERMRREVCERALAVVDERKKDRRTTNRRRPSGGPG